MYVNESTLFRCDCTSAEAFSVVSSISSGVAFPGSPAFATGDCGGGDDGLTASLAARLNFFLRGSARFTFLLRAVLVLMDATLIVGTAINALACASMAATHKLDNCTMLAANAPMAIERGETTNRSPIQLWRQNLVDGGGLKLKTIPSLHNIYKT
jgi:hypothetical protein